MYTIVTPSQEKKSINKFVIFGLCMICYIFGGTISTLLSVYLPVAVPQLLQRSVSEQELGSIGAYLNSSFIFGWMAGGLISGFLSDKFGRIKILAISACFYGLFTFLVITVSDWHTLIFYRFFAGMGVGAVLVVSTVYISEIWDESSKPVALSILSVGFPAGIILAGILNVFFSVWKHSFILGVVPFIAGVLSFFILPESLSWQSTKYSNQKDNINLFTPRFRPNIILGSLIFGSVLIGLWAVFSWLPTWVQGLTIGKTDGKTERGIAMMIMGTGAIMGGSFAGHLIKKWGIQMTLMFIFAGCFLSCLLLFITNSSFSKIVFIEVALVAIFFGLSQSALSSFIPSLFPPSIRAMATGFCFNIGRFFTGTAVFFVGNLVTVFGGFGNALLVFSVTFLIALLIVFLKFNRNKQSGYEQKY